MFLASNQLREPPDRDRHLRLPVEGLGFRDTSLGLTACGAGKGEDKEEEGGERGGARGGGVCRALHDQTWNATCLFATELMKAGPRTQRIQQRP